MKPVAIVFIILSLTCLGNGQTSQVVVKTDSMEPGIHINDLLIADEEYYSTRPIERFDVVVFKQPMNAFKAVARVIALGGETITIKKNKVFIDGNPLMEPIKTKPCSKATEDEVLPCANFGPFKVPEGEFFLLADNRGGSEDSRLWSPNTINRSQIVGKVIKIVPKKNAA
jgi:signal peptidase I